MSFNYFDEKILVSHRIPLETQLFGVVISFFNIRCQNTSVYAPILASSMSPRTGYVACGGVVLVHKSCHMDFIYQLLAVRVVATIWKILYLQ